jgi:hypothetical protein
MKRQCCIKCGRYHNGKVRKAGYILGSTLLCNNCDPEMIKIKMERLK